MGNQIVCPTGSDWYRRDLILRNYQILNSLFDGTFSLSFKVENIYNKKLKVIKVFWIDSPQTGKIVEMFNKTFEKMLKIPTYLIFGNLFSEPYVTKNGAYLIRPYLEQPLTERITDSPPLHYWEKKWIAFQLLQAVKNLGEQGFWHGDIKPENVMVTSSLRVYLVDHAPFKPSMIGTNQPHYFIHFFSYMRSCCFLAPERITDSNKYINFFAADIFSVACVIAYMYLNGSYLFNYTTIQQLKDDSEILLLNFIDDQNVRSLIRSLLIVDHRARLRNFHNFENFFPPWFSEFYKRFRFALDDGRPNAIVYSFNREFLNSILTSSNSKSKSKLRRKSTSCLELNSSFFKCVDVDLNNNSTNFQGGEVKSSVCFEMNSKSASENNSNLILETTPDTSSEISSISNSELQPLSSIEIKHHFNSQIIQNSISELKQYDSKENSTIPANKEKSSPVLTRNKSFGLNSLPIRRLRKPSTIAYLKEDDPLIICIPIIADAFFSSKITSSDLNHLIRLFIHLSIRLKDPILKLTRCIPHIIGLFDHNNTAINVMAVNGLISIISSIAFVSFKIRLFESNCSNDPENIELINLMPDYHANYLIPHLYSSIKGSWSQQFFARLPFLIVHISRLWPSFLTDIHNTKRPFIKNFITDQIVMRPFIRSSAQISVFFYNFQKSIKNAKKRNIKETTVYPLFQCFNKYMKILLNLSVYNSELVHFYSMYIVNFQPRDLSKFIKNDLLEIVSKMSNLLQEQNKSNTRINYVSLVNNSISALERVNKNYNDENYVSILLFFYELLLYFNSYLPLPILSIIACSASKLQYSRDRRIRTVVKQIYKNLPDSFSFVKFANTPLKKLSRQNTYQSNKNIASEMIDSEKRKKQKSEDLENTKRIKNFFENYENSMKNDQVKPLFLYSQKMFQGEVNAIFLHQRSTQTTFFHSKTTLSLFELDESLISKFNQIKAINFHDEINFLTRISDQRILLSSGQKVYVTNNAQLKATVKLSNEILYFKKFYNNQLLTRSKNSPSSISVRSINRCLEIASTINLNGTVPTCIEIWPDQPFFSIGTEGNFVYTIDTRVGVPVYSIHTGPTPFDKLITFPYSFTYQFGIVSTEKVDFFDPRMVLLSNESLPYFRVKGSIGPAFNYCTGALVLGSNGTFYVNPNGNRKTVVSLLDNKNCVELKNLNKSRYEFELPECHQKSLHNHMFPILSLDYNKSSGLCCSGDKAGFVHMWLPPHLKYLNGDY